MMVADYSHVAYEAARRDDMEGVYAVVTELVRMGRPVVELAMRNWINRTLLVMAAAGGPEQQTYMLLEMEATDSGTPGEADDINCLPAPVAWAGRMFMAHARRDAAMWVALWGTLPPDPEVITEHIIALLTTMTITAASYAETTPEPGTPPAYGLRGWIRTNPETAATRIAVSHMN